MPAMRLACMNCRKGEPLNSYFYTYLGQSADVGKKVQDLLADYPSEALDLFPSELGPTKKPKSGIYQHLSEETQNLCPSRFVFRCRTCIRIAQAMILAKIFRPGLYQVVHWN